MPVKKTSSRAKVNVSNKTKAKAAVGAAIVGAATAKSVKKAGKKGLLVAIICLFIGIAIGIGGYFVVCRNDTFEIIGNDEITITINDVYEDKGVKIIEFGKDISEKAVTETNLTLNADNKPISPGNYYIKYTVDSLKYGKIFKITKIRIINVVEIGEAEGGI